MNPVMNPVMNSAMNPAISSTIAANALMLTLIANRALEAELVDALSALADYPLMMVSHESGHNDTHRELSLAEQVEGIQPLMRVSLQTDATTQQAIIQHLAMHFNGAGIRWWSTPISAGEIA